MKLTWKEPPGTLITDELLGLFVRAQAVGHHCGRGEICPMPFGLSDAQLHAVMLALAPLDPSKRAESPTLRAASWSKFRRY